ncbi:MAG: asparaginase [Myxococcota bacterium]
MKRVLLIHTGGTLAMVGEPLEPDAFASALTERVPELEEIASLDSRTIASLDSSDVGPEVWTQLVGIIEETHGRYDGYVIVHGTDTMPYTASALSFALTGLDRPIVLTGAQRPLAALRTDARRNLTDAVELATCDIPEVGICFDGQLLRGCRTVKNNAVHYHAFECVGDEPLARMGVNIEISDRVRKPSLPFMADGRFDDAVAVITMTPALDPGILEHILAPPALRGVVLVAFGLGTVPTKTRPMHPVFERAIARGVDVVAVTQSAGTIDLSLYANSRLLHEVGVLSGGAMTMEAAYVKLMHAMALYPSDRAARRRYMTWDVAGELTRGGRRA